MIPIEVTHTRPESAKNKPNKPPKPSNPKPTIAYYESINTDNCTVWENGKSMTLNEWRRNIMKSYYKEIASANK